MSQVAFLVFDIETVADGRLIQRIRYPGESELSPAAAVTRYREELMESKGSDFIPHTFQLPVSVAIAKVGPDHRLVDITSLDRPAFRPQVICQQFWKGWQHYGQPTFVTFNGRGFDLPVMEMSAFRYGQRVPAWFTTDGPGYTQPRNRFNPGGHVDLQELLTNFGATRQHGGLDLCATLLGKPGKMDTKGFMVQDLWEAGEALRIDDYCYCDALDTYFVFLRMRVLQGFINLEKESQLVKEAKELIAKKAEEIPALQGYLDAFTNWTARGDDDWAFLDPADAQQLAGNSPAGDGAD